MKLPALNKNWIKNIILSIFFIFFCINNAPAKPVIPKFHDSPYQEPVFVALVLAIIFMLIMILVLASVLKSILYYKFKIKNQKEDDLSNKTKIYSIVILFVLFPYLLSAQEVSSTKSVPQFKTEWFGIDALTFWSMVGLLLFELVIALFYVAQIKKLLGKSDETKAIVKTKSSGIIQLLTRSIPLENEKDVLLDHDYDGIKELDNDLPPWWKYGFYFTIVAGIVYLLHYHVFKTGRLQEAEYYYEIAQAELKLEEYRKKAADMITENNVTYLTDESSLKEGKNIYNANCAVCHGNNGEGKVGPNLTDNYWLHGGTIQDIFISVKYGWPDKGMKSWQTDLSSRQIHRVSSYVKSLQGTNPANAKDPEGQIFLDEQHPIDSISPDTTNK